MHSVPNTTIYDGSRGSSNNININDINKTTDQTQHVGDEPVYYPPIINENVMFYFRVVNWVIICQAISIFGILSNVVNMIVFVKTGFKESINISLFALAISDFGSCCTLIFSTIAMNPWFQKLDIPVDWDEVQYISACWPHVAFTKITTLITAFITFERCLCVSVPLKVKTIITRERVIAYLVASYLVNIALVIPIFYCNQLGKKFYPELNKTLIGLVFTDDRPAIEGVVFPISNAILALAAFIFIMISTAILVYKLNQKSKWRMKATATSKTESNESSTKEQRISVMVATISTLFIISFFPTAGMQIVMWFERRMNVDGAYSNLNFVIAYFTFTFEAINSAVNIFIYYRNSSNYKAVFDQIFFSKKQ